MGRKKGKKKKPVSWQLLPAYKLKKMLSDPDVPDAKKAEIRKFLNGDRGSVVAGATPAPKGDVVLDPNGWVVPVGSKSKPKTPTFKHDGEFQKDWCNHRYEDHDEFLSSRSDWNDDQC